MHMDVLLHSLLKCLTFKILFGQTCENALKLSAQTGKNGDYRVWEQGIRRLPGQSLAQSGISAAQHMLMSFIV